MLCMYCTPTWWTEKLKLLNKSFDLARRQGRHGRSHGGSMLFSASRTIGCRRKVHVAIRSRIWSIRTHGTSCYIRHDVSDNGEKMSTGGIVPADAIVKVSACVLHTTPTRHHWLHSKPINHRRAEGPPCVPCHQRRSGHHTTLAEFSAPMVEARR